MRNGKVIGGEFDLDMRGLSGAFGNDFLKDGFLYSSGRAALYNILLSIEGRIGQGKALYLPDYLCHTIAQTAQKTSFVIKYYRLNDSLEIDRKDFENRYEKGSAVLLINYFGLQTLSFQIDYLKSLDSLVCVIEDNVQSFHSMFEDSKADYRFTSFRKSLPVPDGGWVKTSFEMPQPAGANTFAQYKVAGGILKSLRDYGCVDDSLYLKLLEEGESRIDGNLTSGISRLSLELFSGIDTESEKSLRQRNAAYVSKCLKQVGVRQILGHEESKVALFIPVWLEDRDKARKALFSNQIFCPVHWPVEPDITGPLAKGQEMAGHELSIIVDQRYGLQEMDMIIDTLLYGN